MLFFWYCFDDYFARVTGDAWLGTIPWWVILLLHLPLAVFGRRSSSK